MIDILITSIILILFILKSIILVIDLNLFRQIEKQDGDKCSDWIHNNRYRNKFILYFILLIFFLFITGPGNRIFHFPLSVVLLFIGVLFIGPALLTCYYILFTLYFRKKNGYSKIVYSEQCTKIEGPFGYVKAHFNRIQNAIITCFDNEGIECKINKQYANYFIELKFPNDGYYLKITKIWINYNREFIFTFYPIKNYSFEFPKHLANIVDKCIKTSFLD